MSLFSNYPTNYGDYSAKSLRQYENVCLFCYKKTAAMNTVGGGESVGTFLKFVEGYLGEGIMRHFDGGRNMSLLLEEKDSFGCCDSCCVIITSFCDVYQQWKCLEAQLEWKLESLVEIMKLANRIPSRVEGLNNMFLEGTSQSSLTGGQAKEGGGGSREKTLKSLENLRADMIKKCVREVPNFPPKVLQKRKQNVPDDSGDSTSSTDCEGSQESVHENLKSMNHGEVLECPSKLKAFCGSPEESMTKLEMNTWSTERLPIKTKHILKQYDDDDQTEDVNVPNQKCFGIIVPNDADNVILFQAIKSETDAGTESISPIHSLRRIHKKFMSHTHQCLLQVEPANQQQRSQRFGYCQKRKRPYRELADQEDNNAVCSFLGRKIRHIHRHES